jgi:hypothetical protein
MEQEVEQRAIRKDWKEKEEPKEFGETGTPTGRKLPKEPVSPPAR